MLVSSWIYCQPLYVCVKNDNKLMRPLRQNGTCPRGFTKTKLYEPNQPSQDLESWSAEYNGSMHDETGPILTGNVYSHPFGRNEVEGLAGYPGNTWGAKPHLNVTDCKTFTLTAKGEYYPVENREVKVFVADGVGWDLSPNGVVCDLTNSTKCQVTFTLPTAPHDLLIGAEVSGYLDRLKIWWQLKCK
ncbi:MAG: hypothetical protein NZO16_06820 [Deltaproteobacteria bacterium]|nr:hypothetical protein [Deltaproteobacteria bacterium]